MLKVFVEYLNERFPLTLYLPLVLLFYFAMYLFAGVEEKEVVFSFRTFFGFLVVFLMFFHLRLFDDLKDYKRDASLFPDRLLSRKQITVNQLKHVSIVVIGFELVFSLLLGFQTVLFYMVMLLYSVLMYLEFFIKNWHERSVLLYNFSHQIIVILMGFFVYVVYHSTVSTVNLSYLCFILTIFLVFTLFEFTRKIKGENDSDFKRSYVYLFGRKKFFTLTVSLLLLTSGLSVFVLASVPVNPLFYMVELLFASCVFILIIFYLNREKHLDYRAVNLTYSLFMLVTLLLFAASVFLSKQFVFKVWI
ncbi:MAG: UbiA family prenyltransferase [Thermoplasmata archaeon]|nr:UbiA family prenyltransferase [Thermoplasmata archaeon]